MIDIIEIPQGRDIEIFDTEAPRAKNILSSQLGYLAYLPEVGIDLDYFLTEKVSFQNDSFKAYLVEVLANNGINVSSVLDVVSSLYSTYNINIMPNEQSSGFMAR